MTSVGRFARCAAVVFVLATMALPVGAGAQEATPAGVEGDTYTSPTFGYSLTWDSGVWSVDEAMSQDGYDLLTLVSENSAVYFEGDYFYGGDPQACIEGEAARIAEDVGADSVALWIDAEGTPLADAGEGYAAAMFDVPAAKDGSEPADAVFVECDTIVPGSAVLIVTIFMDPADVDNQMALVAPVLDSISFGAPAAAEIDEADLEQMTRAAAADINAFWDATFQEMGQTYQDPLIQSFTGPIETECGDAQPGESGPFYCPSDMTVYLDIEDITTSELPYGRVFYDVVIAHEIGHHVQNLLGLEGCTETVCGIQGNSLAIELQADCFAGSWLANDAATNEIDQNQLGRIEQAMDEVMGDPIDVPADDPEAHGTADQRLQMFYAGFDNGIAACGLS